MLYSVYVSDSKEHHTFELYDGKKDVNKHEAKETAKEIRDDHLYVKVVNQNGIIVLWYATLHAPSFRF